MKLLLQQLQGDSDPEREIMLDTELIVRASSADRIQAGGDGI